MTNELFPINDELHRLSLQDAEVYFLRKLALQRDIERILADLIRDTPWRSEEVAVWGRRFKQPRLVAWYGDPGSTYTYSGIHLAPLPWTTLLLEVKMRVEDASRTRFNSLLLNYYRDQHDSMGMHSDDERELGPRPVIASLSLGQQRTLILRHKTRRDLKSVRLPLPSGSLLVMAGETQRNWLHGIGKEARMLGPRVNLTFRQILLTA